MIRANDSLQQLTIILARQQNRISIPGLLVLGIMVVSNSRDGTKREKYVVVIQHLSFEFCYNQKGKCQLTSYPRLLL